MKKILYIDTSVKYSSILLFDEVNVLSQRKSTELNMHAKTINLHIEEIFHETNATWAEIAAIAVMNGPGSYTGLRIGLSSAKGFCYAHDIPLLLLNRFQLMNAFHESNSPSGYLILARENEFFFQSFNAAGEEMDIPKLLSSEEILEISKENSLALYADEDNILPFFDEINLIQSEPSVIQKLVTTYFLQRNFADLMHSEPFYLKNVHINKINKL